MKKLLEQYFSLIRKFLPEETLKPGVGIEIGPQSCKMIELQKEGDAFKVLNWGIEPVENQNVQKSIKILLGKLSPPYSPPVTSLFGKGTLIRFIQMPRMSSDELKKSFILEADKYFPFSPEQIYMDCHILNHRDKNNKMSVLVAAAKKDLVDNRISLLSSLELQTNYLTLDAIAIANVYQTLSLGRQETPQTDKRTVAILNMGATLSNLMVLIDGFPYFVRDIFIGGREFTKNLSYSMGISIEEAEKLKCDSQKETAKVLEACDSTILNLASEIRLSFDYFVTEKNVPVEQLLLTGGASMMEDLPALLSKYLELDVKIWNPLEGVLVSDQLDAARIQEQGARLGVALGLAMF